MKIFYPAIIDKDPTSDYGVTFPDFPGCVTAGETIAEAIAMAEEALALHIDGLREDNRSIPEPSPPDAIADHPDIQRVALVLIPADRPGRMVRVNVTLDEALLARIDRVCGPRGRSGFMADAAARALAGQG